MADISLNLDASSMSYGDLLIVGNDLLLTADANPNGTNNILQDVIQRLRFFLGEWFLDNTFGVPWYQQILVKNPDVSKINVLILNTIAGTPGIITVSSYSFKTNFSARTFKVSFAAQTTNGPVDYSGTLLSGGV